MSALSSDLIGRVLGGRYRLVRLLGVGASARVFLADDPQLQRPVAVKVLHDALAADPTVRRRFATEARAAAALNHPHLVAVYDVGEEDGVPFLVTEYLAGGSLRSLLDAGKVLSPSQALLIGLEAARGLEHAHRAGLVHRDIKPANLLFGEDGRLRIADFGLAKVLADAALTEPTSSPLGTARYLAPEQARGEAASPASDIYSLALVLVEAVTGQLPFGAEHPVGGLVSRTERSLEVPAALGPLRGPLERAGRLDPSERPDAGELGVSLLATAGELPRPAPLPLVIGTDHDDTTTRPVPAGAATLIEEPSAVAPLFLDVPAEPPGSSAASAPNREAAPYDETSRDQAPYDQALEDDAPEAHRGLAFFAAFLVVLAAIAVAGYVWWESQPVTHPMPDLVGLSRDEIDAAIGEFGWDVEINETRVEGSTPDEIVEQDPEPGTELEEGDRVTLTVSLGNPLVAVPPDLVGRDVGEVTADLEAAGLAVGDVTEVFDEDVPAGQVMAVSDNAIDVEELPSGTAIDLTVSKGAEPRQIPDLTGMDRSDAAATLHELGLDAVGEETPSTEHPVDVVIRTEPSAGSTVDKGATVTLIISSGPPFVEVPDVRGMEVDEATEALEAAGLGVAGVTGPPNREVVSTDPAVGDRVREGTEVTLITRRPPSDDD